MSARERLLEALEDYEPAPVLERSLSYDVVLPAKRFRYIAIPFDTWQALIVVLVSSFDEALARRLESAMAALDAPATTGPVLRGRSELSNHFDEFVLLPPRGHGYWRNELPDLHPSTFALFPIAHCEWPETADVARIKRLRLDSGLDTTNWSRAIDPAVELAYHNAVTHEGTHSSEPELLGYRALRRAFASLAEKSDDASWIRARNWRGEEIRATYDERIASFEVSGAIHAQVALSGVEATLRQFFER